MTAEASSIREDLRRLILSAAAMDGFPGVANADDLDEILRSIDSLAAMRLIIMIRNTFNVEVAPMDLFLCESVGELSEAIAAATPA